MTYVLSAVLLIALVVWIVHNVRAIIKMRKKKKEGKTDADKADGDASLVAGEETSEEKPND